MNGAKLIGRVLGVSTTTDTRRENDETTIEYAKLVGNAKSEVRIVSGKLKKTVYCSSAFLSSLDRARRRGVLIDILTGPMTDKDNIDELKSKGAKVRVLDKWPRRHFAVVDQRHVRIEEPHSESEDDCVQFIVHNYKHAGKLYKYFLNLKEANS